MRWGGCVLKWWSKTQPTIALSSGEAELAALVRATSEGLGMKSIMDEFGFNVKLKVKSDAKAAIGIVKRQGLGRVRHLAVADLWIQQRAKEGSVIYEKLPGPQNTSDILTKPIDAETLEDSSPRLTRRYSWKYREKVWPQNCQGTQQPRITNSCFWKLLQI